MINTQVSFSSAAPGNLETQEENGDSWLKRK